MEIWKTIPILDGNYEASNFGRIRSKKRTLVKKTRYGGVMLQTYPEKILGCLSAKGYYKVHLGLNRKKRTFFSHRLVLLAFYGLPLEDKSITRHLNGNPADNRIQNLTWGNHFENMQDRKNHGNYKSGQNHVMAKLTLEQVNYIKSSNFSSTDLSRLFDVCVSHVCRIKKNESWKV